jgi:hypothetical protein
LVRYVVNTEPATIVEELLPVAVPVYSSCSDDFSRSYATRVYSSCSDDFSRSYATRLLNARPSPETRTESEVQEALADALAIEGLEQLLRDAVETRRQELVAERRRMREQMEQQEGAQAAAWLQGIDDLSPGSFDLLAVTVYYPT